ncbi:hypothetical protein C1646_775915 [Rhizophagus diaphanus]|nr:hypothetical protein C1646_775915 [Rhizophagus diaphanus] [Rhizophagus sp. MUCL 43196]
MITYWKSNAEKEFGFYDKLSKDKQKLNKIKLNKKVTKALAEINDFDKEIDEAEEVIVNIINIDLSHKLILENIGEIPESDLDNIYEVHNSDVEMNNETGNIEGVKDQIEAQVLIGFAGVKDLRLSQICHQAKNVDATPRASIKLRDLRDLIRYYVREVFKEYIDKISEFWPELGNRDCLQLRNGDRFQPKTQMGINSNLELKWELVWFSKLEYQNRSDIETNRFSLVITKTDWRPSYALPLQPESLPLHEENKEKESKIRGNQKVVKDVDNVKDISER